MSLPILYRRNERGQILYWECRLEGSTYYTRAGVHKNRDNHQWREHKREARYTPDHGGYRSPQDVAMEHMQSLWKQKKRDDNMSEDIGTLDTMYESYKVPVSPVLAMRYSEMLSRHNKPRSKYKFPEYKYLVQPKLDGERCIASWAIECDDNGNQIGEPRVRLFSRLGNEKPYLDHIKKVLTKVYNAFEKVVPGIKTWHFDGELVGDTRNSMRSAVSTKTFKHEDNDKQVYHIFDLITDTTSTFNDRYNILTQIFTKMKNITCIQLVPIIHEIHLGNEDEISQALSKTVEAGYEGLIMRDPNMTYPTTPKTRSKMLIKHKPLHSKEYTIIGADEGTDAHKGLIVFHLQDPSSDYIKFWVTPCFSHAERAEMYQQYIEDPSTFIGRMAEVLYVDLNEYSVPVEARMKCIRDPGTMDTPKGNVPDNYDSDE